MILAICTHLNENKSKKVHKKLFGKSKRLWFFYIGQNLYANTSRPFSLHQLRDHRNRFPMGEHIEKNTLKKKK